MRRGGDTGPAAPAALGLVPAALLALAALGLLGGCGLRPVYAGGASGAVAQGMAAIDVAAISGREGWLVRNALVDRMARSGAEQTPRYRLDVVLDQQLEGLGLLTDDTIGRERLTLRARYQLVDLASGLVMVDATAAADAGIDVVSSEFATIAAEQTAMENLAQMMANQIELRITRALLSHADQGERAGS